MTETSAATETNDGCMATAQRLLGETLVSLAEAARRVPSRRRPGPVTASAAWRWVHEGTRGPGGRVIRLEAFMWNGRWLTSLQALARYAAAQQPPGPT